MWQMTWNTFLRKRKKKSMHGPRADADRVVAYQSVGSLCRILLIRKASQRAVCKVTLPDYCYWLWTWRVGWSLGQTTVLREGVDVPVLTISQVISNRLKYGIGLSKSPSRKLMVLLTLLLLLLLLLIMV